MHILAASSFSEALNKVNYEGKRGLSLHITSISSLSPNPNSRNILKDVRFLVEKSRSLKHWTDLILWHDTVNNSTTNHRSKYFRQWEPTTSWSKSSKTGTALKLSYFFLQKGAPNIVKSLLRQPFFQFREPSTFFPHENDVIIGV